MKILVDMNLSPEWVTFLIRPGWEVRRWNEVGNPKAEDPEIAVWAAEHEFIVLTQDLDFSDILFMTQASAPGIILLRPADELSPAFRAHVLRLYSRSRKTPAEFFLACYRPASCPLASVAYRERFWKGELSYWDTEDLQ